MTDRRRPRGLAAALVLAAALGGLALPAIGVAADPVVPSRLIRTSVVRAIDGESLEAFVDGRLEVVRYIGIGTPRIAHPTRGPEPYRLQAARANAALVEGKEITIEPGRKPRDADGRLLAYVSVGERLVGAELVRLGFAEAVTRPPNVTGRAALVALQRQAQVARVGLWADADALRFYRPAASGVLASRRTMSFFHVDDAQGWFEESREDFDSPEAALMAGYVPSFGYPLHRERDLRAWLIYLDRLDGTPRAAMPVFVAPVPARPSGHTWRGGVIAPVPMP